MDRLDIWILSVLEYNSADNYLVAMSISEILQEEHNTTRISLYKHLKRLVRKKYVATGLKISRIENTIRWTPRSIVMIREKMLDDEV